MRPERGVHLQPGKKEINVPRQQDDPARRADEIRFGRRRLGIALLSRMPRRGDVLAKVARMVAIESLRHSFGQGNALRVLHHHPPPGDGLQDNPMRADRQAQGQDHNCVCDACHPARILVTGLGASRTFGRAQAKLQQPRI
jgi:hypothetical protein